MKKIVYLIVPAFILAMASFSGCDHKPVVKENVCDTENPLTDLLWLKEIIKVNDENREAGFILPLRIFQCTYDNDKTGFLIEPCVDCPDAGYSFRACDGTILCGGGGESGEDTCGEFNIDLNNKVLIYQSF